MSDRAKSLIGRLPAFSSLTEDEIAEVVGLAVRTAWKEGAVIFEADKPADRFFLILEGVVRPIRMTPDGEQMVPLHIPAGELIGLVVAMGRDTYPATAVAASDCVTLSWPSRLWTEFSSRFGGFAAEAWHEIGERLEELQQRITELANSSAEARIAAALLRLMKVSGETTEAGTRIGFPVTRATIAEITGTTIYTVSRLMSGWEKEGIIKSSRKNVTVTDPGRLEWLVGPGNNL